MKLNYFLLFLFLSSLQLQGQELLWEKTIGGDDTDWLHHAFQNKKGNYVFSGYSYSSVSGEKTAAKKGISDSWIIETDTDGNILWQQTFGGSSMDMISKIIELDDGTYLLAGDSYSGIGLDKTEALRGHRDLWLVKLDQNQNIEWQRTYGGNDAEDLIDIVQTNDSGFLLSSNSNSVVSGDKTTPALGNTDIWILKLDHLGQLEWQKSYGGSGMDFGGKIQKKPNGNFIVAASSSSNSSTTKTESSRGLADYWLFEIDLAGNIIWQKTIGGDNGEAVSDIKPTPEGGFIIGGYSASGVSGERTLPVIGFDDYWVLKIDFLGEILWQKVYGGNNTEWLSTISPSQTTGYILGGMSGSEPGGDKTEPGRGDRDFWIFKISEDGEKCWDKTLGGSSVDQPMYGFEDREGNYVLGGWTDSGATGDKEGASRGGRDFWITKISVPEIPEPVVFEVGPYEACDKDGNGFGTFDFSNLEKDLTGNEPNQKLTFFDEHGKPLPTPLPAKFTNTVPFEQIINIKVSRTDFTCSSTYVQVLLVVDEKCEGDGGNEEEPEEPAGLEILFPKYFTPNGDGYNDQWQAREMDRQHLLYIYIFDRFGNLLRQLSPNDQWDGEFNGRMMPSDDYWYRAVTTAKEVINGHFSLIR